MAGTTSVTIHEEVVPSSEGIRGNCALLTDKIHTSSPLNLISTHVLDKEGYGNYFCDGK